MESDHGLVVDATLPRELFRQLLIAPHEHLRNTTSAVYTVVVLNDGPPEMPAGSICCGSQRGRLLLDASSHIASSADWVE